MCAVADSDYQAFLQLLEQGPEQLLSAGLQREAQEKLAAFNAAANPTTASKIRPASRLMESLSLKHASSAASRPVRTPGAAKTKGLRAIPETAAVSKEAPAKAVGASAAPLSSATGTGARTDEQVVAKRSDSGSAASAARGTGARNAEKAGAKQSDVAALEQGKASASQQAGSVIMALRQGGRTSVSAPTSNKVCGCQDTRMCSNCDACSLSWFQAAVA